MRENCTGARMNALRRLLPSGVKYWPLPWVIDVTHRAIFAAFVDEFRGEDVAGAQRHAVLENFFVDDGEAIARLDVEHEVDVVLEDFREIEGDAIGKLRVRGCLEQGAVDGRARGARANFERILEDIAD